MDPKSCFRMQFEITDTYFIFNCRVTFICPLFTNNFLYLLLRTLNNQSADVFLETLFEKKNNHALLRCTVNANSQQRLSLSNTYCIEDSCTDTERNS